MNGFGTSLAGIDANRTGFGELLGSVVTVPRDDPDAFARIAEERGDEVAAFIGEPVVGAGGIFPPEDGYWPAIRRICDESGALLIADEVVTGFGRLGTWFACERFGFEPDLMTVAKGITSGYIPLGAMICGPRVAEPFWSGEAGVFRHGYTYSGHAAACAVGLANLDLIEREGLIQHVAQLEASFAETLRSLADHPLIKEVRTIGLLAGVGFDESALKDRPGLAETVVELARERGILVRALLGHSLQISPPFVIEEQEVLALAQGLREALDAASA
jgi:adenosylmethionine-8-amino-7-oxononanoate aminotransferase